MIDLNRKILVLMGIKHCGKTTQGKRLSGFLECPFYDTDDVIASLSGKTARALYAECGAETFKNAETEACRFIIDTINFDGIPAAVVATGGGICGNDSALQLLKPYSVFLFLEVDEKTACDRIIHEVQKKPDGSFENLPAYIAREKPETEEDIRRSFSHFYTERCVLYKSIADYVLEMPPYQKEKNTKRLLAFLGNPDVK